MWEILSEVSLNERQQKIINLMLDDFNGKLTPSKWAIITKCSQDTAYRDILDLIDQGILVKNSEGGRSTSYSTVGYVFYMQLQTIICDKASALFSALSAALR